MNERLNGSRFWLALPSLFFLSYAVLTFEVALTRIFSVMLDYHYVFAILSAALLGLGLGAMLLKRWQKTLPASAVRMSAVIFALLVAASVLAIIGVPVMEQGGFCCTSSWPCCHSARPASRFPGFSRSLPTAALCSTVPT
jgi:hypothetical protein